MKSKTIKLICVFVLMVVNSGIAQKENIENSDPKGISQQAITPKSSFQSIIPGLLSRWSIPGCAVALVKNERLVFAGGFGYSDRDNALPVTSKSLFRIGSISKPITAVTILKLIEEGLLSLDDKAFNIINDIQPPWRASVDPRLHNITIRHLLQHSGGWDEDLRGSSLFWSRWIAQVMGIPPPADAETIISFMMGQSLDFVPGSRYAYSNLGYSVLGRIVEKVTGENYEDYVKENILAPSGITQMSIGYSLLANRAEDEVIYYDYPGAPYVQSVFSESVDYVPRPYGEFYMKAIDSAGGWIASVEDLMRFITSVDGHDVRPDLLQHSSIQTMIARPNLPDWQGTTWYYAMGWGVQPVGNEAIWWHGGGLPGTITIIYRSYDNLAWVALFNSRPNDDNTFLPEMDNGIWDAVYSITDWPNHDLFVQYNLTISSGSGGTTIPSPGIYTHYGGVEVTVEAIPDAYYCLYGWGEAYQGNENPMVITMNANKNIFAHFRFIFKPIDLSGEKVLNRSLSQAEYINILNWQANPKNSDITIGKYKIYQVHNGGRNLVVELDSNIVEYRHRNVQKNTAYIYEIVAVNSDGSEGYPARIVVE